MGDFLFEFYGPQHRICHRFLKYLTCNFEDLEPGHFKVIQGQRSWCQLIAESGFHIRLLFTPSGYLSPCSRYLTLKLLFH